MTTSNSDLNILKLAKYKHLCATYTQH